MTPPAPATNERERLAALERYEMLDTPREAEFDDLTSLAAQICGTPIALISLVDAHRQWFKSKVGLEADETSREVSFCGHAIHGRHVMEVPDAHQDFLFYDNPLVTGEPGIRFYAGMPLATPDGQKLGTLCVMDRVPRYLSPAQREALTRLGRQVMAQMELRLTNQRLTAASKGLREMEERFRLVVEAAPDAMVLVNEEGRITLVNSRLERLFGYPRDELLNQPVAMLLAERSRPTGAENDARLFGGVVGKGRDYIGLRRNGTEMPIGISLKPLATATGTLLLASFHDVTPRKQEESQISRLRHRLKQKRRQLERADRELADLASAVSRDLMSPLRGVSSLANWIATSYANRLDGSGREQLNLLALKLRRLYAAADGILSSPPRNRSAERQAAFALKAAEISASEKASPPGNGFSRNPAGRPSPKAAISPVQHAAQSHISLRDLEISEPVSETAIAV